MNVNFFNLTFLAYILAFVSYLIYAVFKKEILAWLAIIILGLGFIAQTVSVFLRWHLAGHPPFSNLYESLIFFSWAMVAVYVIFNFVYKLKLIGALVSLLALLALGYASVLDNTIQPLLPALKSNWLTIHVVTYSLGYGAVAVSFAASLLYLIVSKNHALSSSLDKISYRLIAFAFPFLTLGLTTGAVWAKVAWGNYWGWDPKETWSLINWLVYALYLHLRFIKGWQGKRAAYLSIIGFLTVLFTFIGVTLFLPGLHSYK